MKAHLKVNKKEKFEEIINCLGVQSVEVDEKFCAYYGQEAANQIQINHVLKNGITEQSKVFTLLSFDRSPVIDKRTKEETGHFKYWAQIRPIELGD
jgi:hypothetical protein